MQMPLVCATLQGRTPEELVTDSSRALEMGSDLVEIRLDRLWTIEEIISAEDDTNDGEEKKTRKIINNLELDEVDLTAALDQIFTSITTEVVLTCRTKDQGGFFPGNEDQYFEVLKAAMDKRPSWIDLEVGLTSDFRDELLELASDKIKIIASIHHFSDVPSSSEISQEVIQAQDMGDLVKICYKTKDRKDALRIFEAAMELKSSEANFSLMGMGPGGDWARIHAPILGQGIVYATTESGWHLAQQGRINASDLRTAWEVLEYS